MWHAIDMSLIRRPRTPQLAETLFESACLEAGLTANRSHDDQFGWDFIVQFPSLRRGGPADLEPPGATCLVQVKSTRASRPVCRLKLSNALRFAQEQIPCFLVLLTFEGEALQPSAAHVRHVWFDDIGASLKAARQAHVEGDSALHRRSHTIRFTEDERCHLTEVSARIEAAIAGVGFDYGAQKIALGKAVGYEDGFAQGTFTLDESVGDETFIDLMLGRVADVPVSSISMRESRFGMPGPQIIADRPARLSIVARPVDSCLVVVTPAEGVGELTLDGQVFVPGVPGLPDELFRFRVQTPLLELIMRPKGESVVNLSYDSETSQDIRTLADMTRLWSWVHAGEIDLGVWIKGQLLGHGSIRLRPEGAARPWRRLAQALDRLLTFVPERRWPADARFTIEALMNGLPAVETFAAQVVEPGVQVSVAALSPKFLELIAGCSRYLAPAYLDFGEATLFAVIEAPIKEIEPEEGGYSIRLGVPRPLRRAALPGNARANLAHMKAQLELVREECGGGAEVLHGTLGDIETVTEP